MAIRNLQQFNRDANLYGEDLVDIVNAPTVPQKAINPVPVPVAAPTPLPARNAGADFLTKVGANPLYARHNTALNALGKFAGFSGDSVTPEFRQLLSTPSGNAESGDYTYNNLVNTTPTYNQDFVNALQGYKFTPTSDVERSGYNITAPDGRSTVINFGDKSSSFDRLMETAIPLVLSGMAGGALAGPLLGALGVTAPGAIATGIASGGISGGLNAGIQGGDVLKGILMGGVGGGIGGAASPFASSVAKDIVGAGGPSFLADAAKGAITGAARAAPSAIASGNFNNVLTGALSGGVGSGVSNVVGDILPDKMTGNANVDSAIVKGIGGLAGGLAKAGITGGDVDVVNSLLPAVAQGISDEYKLPLKQVEAGLGVASKVLQGKDLAPTDILSIGSAFGISAKGNQAASKPDAGQGSSFEEEEEGGEGGTDETPSIDEELGFSKYTAPTQAPAPQDDIFDILNGVVDSGGYDTQEQTEATSFDPASQQVVVTPPTSSIDQELGFSEYDLPVDLKMSGERSDIALGQAPQQVTITGTVPTDSLYNPIPREVTAIQPPALDLGNYLDTLPQDVLNTLPEILAPSPAPAPVSAPSLTPAKSPVLAPKDNTADITGLLNFLALNQQQPVPSQVLADMPKFDVEREMSGYKREQQPDLAALLAAIGFKG